MGILQKKCRTIAKRALAYRGEGGQNTDTACLALRLGVVLYLLIFYFLELLLEPKQLHAQKKYRRINFQITHT